MCVGIATENEEYKERDKLIEQNRGTMAEDANVQMMKPNMADEVIGNVDIVHVNVVTASVNPAQPKSDNGTSGTPHTHPAWPYRMRLQVPQHTRRPARHRAGTACAALCRCRAQ